VGPAVEPAVNDPFLCSVPNSRFDSHTSSHKFSRTLHAHCRHRPTTSTIRPLAVSTIRKQRQSRAGTVHCSTATFFFVQVPGVTLQHNTTQHKVAPGSYQGRLRLLPSRREACGLFSYTETSFWGSAVFGSERGTSQHGLAVSEMRICGY
jgi:hypothetical protein